jgi:DNA-binding beta-propeller fold protein YncE
VNVLEPPEVSLTAEPAVIRAGDAARLAWRSANADSVTIDGGIGQAGLEGAMEVRPGTTTTYTAVAEGPGGRAAASATVEVLQRPAVSITAEPGVIDAGQASVLRWTARNADSAEIDQGIGVVGPEGTCEVRPGHTATYTITAAGPGGAAQASVTVEVRGEGQASRACAYITNNAGTGVNVIDLGTGEALAAIEVGNAPYGVAVSPDGDRVYVTTDDGLAVIDAATRTVEAVVPVIAATVAVSPDGGVIYTVSPEEGVLRAFNASTRECMGSVEVGMSPRAIAVKPDGTKIYVGCLDGGGISVIDPAGLEVVGSVAGMDPWASVCDLETSPDGSRLYAVSDSSCRLTVIETSTDTIVDSRYYMRELVPYDLYIAVSPDGAEIYLSCYRRFEGAVMAIDARTLDVKGELEVLRPSDMCFTPDGASVLVPDLDTNGVFMVDADTCRVASSLAGGFNMPYTCGHYVAQHKERIQGRLTCSGAGVEGVAAAMSGGGAVQSALTDRDGEYFFYAPEGDWTVSFQEDGFMYSSRALSVQVNGGGVMLPDVEVLAGVKFRAEPRAVRKGESAVLRWDAVCAGEAEIDQGIGEVAPAGSREVTPEETTAYTITVHGPQGALVSKSIELTVLAPPVVSITAADEAVAAGQSTTLRWKCTGADSARIEPYGWDVDPEGSLEVTPDETTTFTLAAQGPGGTAEASVTVRVIMGPSISLSVEPAAVRPGRQASLSWSVDGAAEVFIDNGIGSVGPSGSVSVSPLETTTYTLGANGPGGGASASVTLTVLRCTVTGAVRDAATSRPIPGVRVTVRGGDASVTAVTGDDGRFSASGDICGSVTVVFEKEGYEAGTREGVISPQGDLSMEALLSALPDLAVWIEAPEDGSMVNASPLRVTGGVRGAQSVMVNGVRAVISGEAFEALVPLEEGLNTITAVACDSYGRQASSRAEVTLVPASSGAAIRGVVQDSRTLEPLADVNVSAADSEGTKTASSLPDGSFTLEGLAAGPVTVRLERQGYASKEFAEVLSAGDSLNITVRMDPVLEAAGIEGFVVDAVTGEPLEGSTVSVKTGGLIVQGSSGRDGSYSVTGLATGLATIVAERQGYLGATFYGVIDDMETYRLDLKLYRAGSTATVYGTAADAATGEAQPAVLVTHVDSGISAVTGPDGGFVMAGVPMGLQSFMIEKQGFVEKRYTADIFSDPFRLDIVEPMDEFGAFPSEVGPRLTGKVVDALSGRPLAGATVRVANTELTTVTDSQGAYTLAGIPYGQQDLTAVVNGHEGLRLRPTVVPGLSNSLDFHLPPTKTGVVQGVVTNAVTGLPVGYAQVRVKGSSLLATNTGCDGAYVLVSVPVGTHDLEMFHPLYRSAARASVSVEEGSPQVVNAALEPRPALGTLRGVVRDGDTGGPVAGARLTVNGRTAVTDALGAYSLSGVSAGMATVTIDAQGYITSVVKAAVNADRDDVTPTINTADFLASTARQVRMPGVSEYIVSTKGGSLTSADGQLTVVFPPGSLSADAIVTLMSSADGPRVQQGEELELDGALGFTGSLALGDVLRLVIEPALPGDPIPSVDSWVILSFRYPEDVVNGRGIDEDTILPYVYDGTRWSLPAMKPQEKVLEPVNNMVIAVVSLGRTETGTPLSERLGTREPVLLAQLGAHVPDLNLARIYDLIAAGLKKSGMIPSPNVRIYDNEKGDVVGGRVSKLSMVPEDPTDIKMPSPNALPLLVFHGWDALAAFVNRGAVDPNEHDSRYFYIIDDLVKATNGVYRPVFLTYNTRCGIEDIGNEVARRVHGPGSDLFKGLPVAGREDTTGRFPFYDTFGFSMGGLISRTYQAQSKRANGMLIVGTPNHGTYGVINRMLSIPELVVPIREVLALVCDSPMCLSILSPGTADLLYYDDAAPEWTSGNPSLHALNRNPKSVGNAKTTLIAGTDSSAYFYLPGFLLSEPNDSVVPADSVFCFKSNATDRTAGSSLLSYRGLEINDCIYTDQGCKDETYHFSHFNFGTKEFNLSLIIADVLKSFSDWTIAKSKYFSYNNPLENTSGMARVSVGVQYNTSRRDIDRVVLVIYTRDKAGVWHIYSQGDNGADVSGNINADKAKQISGVSLEELLLEASCCFPYPDDVEAVDACLYNLRPGQRKVPLTPEPKFSFP